MNYELKEGICLPRCLLYKHYLDFCHTNNELAVNAAAFGKVGFCFAILITLTNCQFVLNTFRLSGESLTRSPLAVLALEVSQSIITLDCLLKKLQFIIKIF